MPRKKDSGPRCIWCDADDAALIRKLRECKDMGMQSESGWKPQVWHLCAECLKGGAGGTKTAEKIADHYTNDDGLKMVTASDDVWEVYIESHNKARKWRNTPFPLYDEILYLVDGIIATGAGAFHAGGATQTMQSSQSQEPTDTFLETQDDSDMSGAGDMSTETLVQNEDLMPSSPICTPAPSRRKRAALSPVESSRKTHKRNAKAASEIAIALRDVASSLNVVGSPEVRQRAIKMMEEDDEFSDGEEVNVMRLFSRDTAIAQTYIGSSKRTTRTAFICSILDDAEL
ncbi:hypothetical protein B0H17DRAFT_1127233 [Mycena rosella]|uniref:Myb/SANT-like domain-containing protein n=1 Tax=Mycena rosella TaxID=1033263 RepID=A0AAD7DZW9_MYCRO|nr:hypothetical protein B0H17DRAFT_1127233 [Mycena rosella]